MCSHFILEMSHNLQISEAGPILGYGDQIPLFNTTAQHISCRYEVQQSDIYFRENHEIILMSSLNLRHYLFDEYRKESGLRRERFKPGGDLNTVYSSCEVGKSAIKCEKKDDKYVIADGHRRFIEGLLQGYKTFLVEVGTCRADGIPTRSIKLEMDIQGIKLESNSIITVTESNVTNVINISVN